MEVLEKEKTTLKNIRVSVISFYSYKIVKNEHYPVSFQILYLDDLFK